MKEEPLADYTIGAVYRYAARVPGINPESTRLYSDRHVILIHGFNANYVGAAKSYDAFRKNIHDVAPGLNDRITTLKWPGKLAYWDAVTRASGDAAHVLAGFLEASSVGFRGELVFIAHSLGCRLVLEALGKLAPAIRQTLLPRIRLFLMAAAVPTAFLAAGGPLRQTVEDCARAEIFFSKTDQALGLVFSVGQWAELGYWSEAVGLKGAPQDLWGRRRHDMTGYLHGTYWTSETVAYRIALALRAAKKRPMSRQDMKDRIQAKRAPSGRDLPRRLMGSRGI